MSGQNFSTLTAESVNLLPAQKLKVFTSEAYDRVKGIFPSPVVVTVPTVPSINSISNGVITIHLTFSGKTDVILYEGTRIRLAGGDYYLAEELDITADGPDFTAGVKLEMASNTTTPLTGDETYNLLSYIPYYSANSISLNDGGETIEENVFSNGFAMEKAMIGLNQSVELSGPSVVGDPGLAVAKQCRNTGKVTDIEVVYPFCKGFEEFTGIVSDVPRTAERSGFVQVSTTVGVTGTVGETVTA